MEFSIYILGVAIEYSQHSGGGDHRCNKKLSVFGSLNITKNKEKAV